MCFLVDEMDEEEGREGGLEGRVEREGGKGGLEGKVGWKGGLRENAERGSLTTATLIHVHVYLGQPM